MAEAAVAERAGTRRLLLGLIGLTALAALVRFWRIGHQSYWLDEAYTVSLVSLQEDGDLAPLLAGLPNDQCPCTHWGYMFKGTQTATYSDHEETYEAGEAFVMTPGHTARATAGSEFVVFSVTEEFAPVEAHMASKMQGQR